VKLRLDLVEPHKEAVRRGATLFALPIHAADGARALWETADAIWTALGDTSDDLNWYSKRAILSGVYSSTVLYWLGDQSAEHSRDLGVPRPADRGRDAVRDAEEAGAREPGARPADGRAGLAGETGARAIWPRRPPTCRGAGAPEPGGAFSSRKTDGKRAFSGNSAAPLPNGPDPATLGQTDGTGREDAMTDTMRAIEISAPGGPEVLRPATRPVPEPMAEQILIAVDHAGVNRPDALQRAGSYAPPPGASDLPGLEAAGVVARVGPGVTRWKEGDAVTALLPGGGYAEYALTHQDHALPVPRGMGMAEAAALCETFFTVWTNVFMRGG
jgi:hypothetical protein